ncbi:Putative Eukaryotic initiation factor 4E [[Torrubiella] hemipterigena]|uniref:Putative Eukaryotic initiation factor 4E n=1 Tax=[Torrubiella] hemipterigena TaxID=1531966 RepID=A0A0A1SSP7_9HYPO|nr:Putative Eukaryotic initiation factor 4E [[Torrubiella] hemipterigena]
MDRPQLFTRGLSGLSQSTETNSPAEQRDDAKRNFLKTMRPLPTQHYWNVFFDRQTKEQSPDNKEEYSVELEQVGTQIESVQDFWRYNNNMPVANIKMRESLYLFKSGFKPVWEDRRNIKGGSWTFRVPKTSGPDFWTHVQMLAIGEQLEESLAEGDQLCGVGLSVRFNSHLITIWHRDASKQASIDGMLACVLADIPAELRPRPDNYFYKKHSEHAGFKVPPELQHLVDGGVKTADASPTA